MTFDVNILFKIAAIGLAIALLNQILSKAGRDEEAMMVTLVGVIIVLTAVIKLLSQFFREIQSFLDF